MTDPLETLERELRASGIPSLALRGYVALLQRSPLTVAGLSRELGLDRSEGYRLTRSLRSLGLVSGWGRPLSVSARAPPEVLSALHRRVRARRDRLARVLEHLEREEGTRGLGPWDFQRARPLRLVEGERRVTEAFEGIMELARRRVDSFLYIEGAARAGNFARLRAATRTQARGVRFRAVVEVTAENLPFFEQASALGAMRHVPGLRYTRYYVIDGKGVLLLLLPLSRQPRRHSEVAIWLTSPELVRFFAMNFEQMFGVGQQLSQRVAELRRGLPLELPLDPRRLGGALERLHQALGSLGAIYGAVGSTMDLTPSLERLASELGRSLACRPGTREGSLALLRRRWGSRKLGRLTWEEGTGNQVRWEGCTVCGAGGNLPSFCEKVLRSAVGASLGPGWRLTDPPSASPSMDGVHRVWTERILPPPTPRDGGKASTGSAGLVRTPVTTQNEQF